MMFVSHVGPQVSTDDLRCCNRPWSAGTVKLLEAPRLFEQFLDVVDGHLAYAIMLGDVCSMVTDYNVHMAFLAHSFIS